MSDFDNLLNYSFEDSNESDIELLISSVSDRSDNKNKTLDTLDSMLSTAPIQSDHVTKQKENDLFVVPVYQTILCFDGKRYIYKANSNIYSLIIE